MVSEYSKSAQIAVEPLFAVPLESIPLLFTWLGDMSSSLHDKILIVSMVKTRVEIFNFR